MADEKIRALFIFEILGKPPEHIKSALNQMVDKFGEIKGIKIINKKIHEPKPMEDEEGKEEIKDLYTCFAEVELELDNINFVFDITLSMLPSHVEILEPEELILKNFELSSAASGLTVKLHRYDEIAKALTMERNLLINKLKEMQMEIQRLGGGIKVEEIKEEPDKKNSEKKISEGSFKKKSSGKRVKKKK